MSLNPGTFLKRTEDIVTGYGFKKHIAGISVRDLTEADGDKLDNGSTPPMAAFETNSLGIQVASSATFIGELDFIVPEDYDETADYLRFRFLAVSGGTTDTPSIDAAIYRKRPSTALSDDLNPIISAVIPISTSYADWREINADGLSVQAGDHLHIEFSLGGTRGTNDTVDVSGLEVVYASDLVYYDNSDRSTA